MKLLWSRQAQQDLLEIGRYIARDNRSAARMWVERLRQRAADAAEHPMAGRVASEYARSDLREVVLRSYRIVYFIGDGVIEVLTVFEAHRLFPAGVLPPVPDEQA